MKLKIKFVLTKGDGEMPDLRLLPIEKQNKDYILSCMKFMPAFEDVEDVIESWTFIDDGLGAIEYKEGNLLGYPSPIIEISVNKNSFGDRFDDHSDFLHSIWESCYRLSLPSLNENKPFYFCDFNGYSKIL